MQDRRLVFGRRGVEYSEGRVVTGSDVRVDITVRGCRIGDDEAKCHGAGGVAYIGAAGDVVGYGSSSDVHVVDSGAVYTVNVEHRVAIGAPRPEEGAVQLVRELRRTTAAGRDGPELGRVGSGRAEENAI